MATYWENSCSFGLRYVSWYKYLIVSLVFSHLGFWSGNLFLIAPFPDLCLLVPFYLLYLKFDLSLMTFRRLRYSRSLRFSPPLKDQLTSYHKAGKFRKFCLKVSVAWPASPISYSLQGVFFFGSFTCLRWCGESLLPLFVHFITAYWRRLARRSNFGAYEL